jgi:hypothetical protein
MGFFVKSERITWALGVALFLTSACGGGNPQQDSSPSPMGQGSLSAAPSSPGPSDVRGDVLFEDDFSSEDSGWPNRPSSSLRARGLELGYADGGYELAAQAGAKVAYFQPSPDSTSANHVVIEVDAVHAGRHALYGVFCKGDQDLANAYTFVLDSTGSWAVAKIRNARLELLGSGTDPAIEPGVAVNHIRADCFDKEPLPNPVAHLRMWINGKLVFRTLDRPGFSGPHQSIHGFYLESDFEGDVRIIFDNFVVWGVDPDELTA